MFNKNYINIRYIEITNNCKTYNLVLKLAHVAFDFKMAHCTIICGHYFLKIIKQYSYLEENITFEVYFSSGG